MIEFICIAALWGGSFLFMRIAVAEFGPVTMIAVRVLIASLVLLPLLFTVGRSSEIRKNLKPIGVLGLINYALPFCLLAYTTQHVTAGFASIINSTAPLFTALVGWLWMNETLLPQQIAGLLLGFGGVAILGWGNISFKPGGGGLAVVSGLLATFLYGTATHYTKRRLEGIGPLSLTAGSLTAASLFLIIPGILAAPPAMPSAKSWGAVALLGLASTALAFMLFFRLLKRWGTTRTIAVGFLIPVFGMLWGKIFLGEPITLQMVLGATVIILGTSLTSGALHLLRRADA